jgi:putative SOS response-associated peptidase YedK
MHWGFLPKWSQGPIVNAQQETIAGKPTFEKAFAARRCLIPADGFYEWKRDGGQKIPMRFVLPGGDTFYFAGIWDEFAKPARGANEGDLFARPVIEEAPAIEGFLILTTSANDVVLPVHNRMPVIVRPEFYDAWLDPVTSEDSLGGVLAHPRNDELTAYRVSSVVNNARNETADCVAPV